MTNTQPDQLMQPLTNLIGEHYVFPDVADAIVAELVGVNLDGVPVEQVAAQLTERIQSVNNDRHLRIRCRPSGALEGHQDWEKHYAAEAIQNAGGVQSVSRRDDRTGLLAIAPYTSPVHLAERYVAAAFELLVGVERLVIDLRAGQGGTPETIALICGYLLGREPVHLQDIVDRDGGMRAPPNRWSRVKLLEVCGTPWDVLIIDTTGRMEGSFRTVVFRQSGATWELMISTPRPAR